MTTAADHGVVIHSLKAVNEREGREGSDLRMNDREAKRGGGRSADRPAGLRHSKALQNSEGTGNEAGAHQSA